MLDAYTVRKAIPRILIAVIGINLSIYLVIAAVDITNVIGRGLGDLLTGPFLQNSALGRVNLPENATTITVGVFGLLGLLGGGAALFAPGVALGAGLAVLGVLVPFVISMALITLAVMFTLIIRQALLIFLAVVSPVAIALSVLPGTEKYFKKWLDLFIKTLMVYPIVAILFAMSTIMAQVLLGTAELSPEGVGLAKILGAIVVVFAPLVLIPFAFKFAGGAISAVMNAASGQASSLSGRASKRFQSWRENPNSLAGRSKESARSKRIESGLTGAQLWAGRPGGDRKRRLGAALERERNLASARSSEVDRAKLYAQNSDVQDSLIMTNQMVAEDKAMLARRVAAGAGNRVLNEDGSVARDRFNNPITGISQQQFESRMQAHAVADSIGRTAANQRAAFLNGDRIKFAAGRGIEGYNDELETAKRIFGDDAAVASAMNAHQAIAPSVGRADLSSALYGEEGDPTRGSSKAGASAVMSGHSNGVRGTLKDHLATINNSDASISQRNQSAQFLANMLSAAQSPYGAGTEENKRLVLEQREAISDAFTQFSNDEVLNTTYDINTRQLVSNFHRGQATVPSGQQTVVTNDDGTQTISASPGGVITGAQLAKQRLDRASMAEIDPSIAGATNPNNPPKDGEKPI